MSLKCGKKGKKITCDLVGDFFLWKETPGLDVAVPGGVSEIGRADIGAYAPPPDDLCVVTFHKAACKPSGFAGQEFSQYWDTDSNALVEAAIKAQRNVVFPTPLKQNIGVCRVGDGGYYLLRSRGAILRQISEIVAINPIQNKVHYGLLCCPL